MKKILNLLICFFFSITTLVMNPSSIRAEIILPQPGEFLPLSPSFQPANLQGMEIHSDNPFHFDFLIHLADSENHKFSGANWTDTDFNI